MAKSQRLSEAAANASADATCALADGGRVCLYAGEQPESADDDPVSNALATGLLSDPAFHEATDGECQARTISTDHDAAGKGRATWFRVWSEFYGQRGVFDGSVGTRDANCIVADTMIEKGAIVTFESLTYRQRKE